MFNYVPDHFRNKNIVDILRQYQSKHFTADQERSSERTSYKTLMDFFLAVSEPVKNIEMQKTQQAVVAPALQNTVTSVNCLQERHEEVAMVHKQSFEPTRFPVPPPPVKKVIVLRKKNFTKKKNGLCLIFMFFYRAQWRSSIEEARTDPLCKTATVWDADHDVPSSVESSLKDPKSASTSPNQLRSLVLMRASLPSVEGEIHEKKSDASNFLPENVVGNRTAIDVERFSNHNLNESEKFRMSFEKNLTDISPPLPPVRDSVLKVATAVTLGAECCVATVPSPTSKPFVNNVINSGL